MAATSRIVNMIETLAVFAVLAHAAPTQPRFNAYPAHFDFQPAPGSAFMIGAGDFNEDGKRDIVIIGSESIRVVLGSSRSIFSDVITMPSPGNQLWEEHPVVADFNRDGHLDLVFRVSQAGNSFFMLLGRGDGSFITQPLSVPDTPNFYKAGDFNGDGIPDLAITFMFIQKTSLYVYLGVGDGTFKSPIVTETGEPFGMAVADFNGDRLDDVVVDLRLTTTLLSNGDGTFRFGASSRSWPGAYDYYAADVNRDGKADLIGNGTDSIEILPGNGDGSFGTEILIPTPDNNVSLTLTDVNRDGLPDCIIGFVYGTSITYENQGGFQFTQLDVTAISLRNAVAGDFLGDEGIEAASDALTVVRLTPDGKFLPVISQPSGLTPIPGVAISATFSISSDFNNDGIQDAAVVSDYNVGILLATGNTSQPFSPALAFSLPGSDQAEELAAADFDRDGNIDLAVYIRASGQSAVLIFRGHGDGTFEFSREYNRIGDYGGSLVTGDFDGDGIADLAAGHSGNQKPVTVYYGVGDGTFQSVNFAVSWSSDGLAVADFNRDGLDDLFVVTDGSIGQAPASASIILAQPGRGFSAPNAIAAELGGLYANPLTADFNHDGNPDILFTPAGATSIVSLGDGTGGFSPLIDTNTGGAIVGPAKAGDLNGDGFPDLVVANGPLLTPSIGDGTGHFVQPFSYATVDGYTSVISDVNRDGRLDITCFGEDVHEVASYTTLFNTTRR